MLYLGALCIPGPYERGKCVLKPALPVDVLVCSIEFINSMTGDAAMSMGAATQGLGRN
jgi:hypothetical protein